MNIILWCALIFLLLCVPALILITAFFILSKKFHFYFKVVGYLKFKDILFVYETETMQINLKVDLLQIYLIWFRCRIFFRGITFNTIIKNKCLSLLKSKPVDKADFMDTFGKKANDEQNTYLKNIKNMFFNLINEKYISKHSLNNAKNSSNEEEVIDNIIKKSEISKKENFLRNLLTFFDFLLEDIQVNFKLSEYSTFHNLGIRKIILGGVKGINKHKEIHFITIAYDIQLKEYLSSSSTILTKDGKINKKDDSKYSPNKNINIYNSNSSSGHTFKAENQEENDYIENTLLINQKLFFNLKLEYGLFPKSFYTIINTMNLKCEVTKTKVEFSTRAIKSIFKIVKQLIKLSKLNLKSEIKNFPSFNKVDKKCDIDIRNMKKEGISNYSNYSKYNDKSNFPPNEINYFTDSPFKKRQSLEIEISPEMLIECVEDLIIKRIGSQMKKMKIKLIDMEVRIVSDNHNYIFTHLNFSNLSYQARNEFNYYCDSNKVKLLKTSGEIKISDLVLSSCRKDKVILDLQNFSLNTAEDVVYYYQTREGAFKSLVNVEVPSVDIVMSTKELDKVIEIIICFVVGLEKLEANSERNVLVRKYVEKYASVSLLNLNFENANVTVYDDAIQTEINNVALNVRIEDEKFVNSKIDIIFNPISLSVFSKNMTDYSSNVLIKGFKINILDEITHGRIDIVFDCTKILLYDNHLIDAMKFVADFLTYCLKGGVKKIHKKRTNQKNVNSKVNPNGDKEAIDPINHINYKLQFENLDLNENSNNHPTQQNEKFKKKKEMCTLLFKKVVIYNYVDFEDLLTLKIVDYDFHVDDWMMMPSIKIYHQSLTNVFLRKRTDFLTLERFHIKFNGANNEIIIDFAHIVVNAYCFELGFAIAKLVIYHSFLPLWINFHMAYKHNIDEDYRKIYVTDFAKKDRCLIKFGVVKVKINQHSISSSAILQTRPSDEAKSAKDMVAYLKKLKSDQITINVKNFVIDISGFKEKESTNDHLISEEELDEEKVTKMRSIAYYKKITKKGEMDLSLESIDIFQENSKLVELNNFRVIINDEFVYDNFDLEKLNTIACSFKMHNLFYKELNSRKTKFTKMEIFIENLKLNLEDIKIIDKITLFYLMGVKTMLSFPFKDYALTEIMDNQQSTSSKTLDLYLKNFETVVNSIDPLTNLIYNRLYLKIDLLSLSIQENDKVNKLELSVFYITFGFEFSQNFDYPLLIIPVCELNIDNILNTMRVNLPNKMIKKLKKVKLETNNYNSNSNIGNYLNSKLSDNCYSDNPLVPEDNIYTSDLDRFIMETKSFTLFLNFNYLNTFYKIFENFWKRSPFVKRYFFGSPLCTKKTNSINADPIQSKQSQKIKETKQVSKEKDNLELSGRKNRETREKNNPFSPNNQNKDNLFQSNSSAEEETIGEIVLFNKEKNKTNNTIKSSPNVHSENQPFKLKITVFDFKIIYLLQFKNEYNSIFKFHTEVKDKGYFGYIIRLYSISLNYLSDSERELTHDELKLNTNLFTVSFLQQENFDDDKFFLYDKEIKLSRFHNLKQQRNFNEFMDLPNNHKHRLINKNFFKFFYYDDEESKVTSSNFNINVNTLKRNSANNLNNNISLSQSETIPLKTENNYVDLIFDYKHTLMKIFDISFKRDTMSVKKIEEIYIKVNDIKFTWNKFNMDVISVLLFKDVLLIVDKIILKIDNGSNKKDTQEVLPVVSDLDLGRFNFVFEVADPQICIQNEIKGSKVLLTTKSKCSAKISKICVNENSKDFKLEIGLNDMALYIAPNYMDNLHVYWIGDSEDNVFYLEDKLFSKMLETPKIQFLIYENIKNNYQSQSADLYTNLNISVDKIVADFASAYFDHFLNVIDVFIFDRGYSYAEQKDNLDSRAADLELFKLDEIQNRIKANLTSFIASKKQKQKEINFTLKDVVLTMLKENKEIIKLMMRNFEGEHIIYTDKSSETSINIKNLKILDLFKNRNETILTPNFEIQNLGELENKIDLVTFRKKDSFVSIGTESKWYVLDYFELNILPLLINTSKFHSDFIIEFFFDHPDNEVKSEEEHKLILIGGDKSKIKDKGDKNKQSVTTINVTTHNEKDKNYEEVDYPIYFKHVRINETQLFISFFLADNSPFNLRNAKLKFSAFEKKDKFYTNAILLHRFIGHLKFISFTNASNILASFFNWGSGNNTSNQKKKRRDDEEAHRKMLLGKQYNK